MPGNLLLIDSSVPEFQKFVDSANDNTFPIVYSPASTKSEILEAIQQNFVSIQRVALVFLGGPNHSRFLDGRPFFEKNDSLTDGENVQFILNIIQDFSVKNIDSLTDGENVQFILNLIQDFSVKNIDFLGCDTLQFPDWAEYYSILEQKTGVVVGASNDKTGNIKYGGDWVMETSCEDIELVYFTENIKYYTYLLDYSSHTVVIKNDGTMWACGNNSHGQLGNGTNNTTSEVLVQVINQTGKFPKQVSTGLYNTFVIMDDNTLWATGYNNHGELANGTYVSSEVLVQMTIPSGKTPIQVVSHTYFCAILMDDGSIYSSGLNQMGQFGMGGIGGENHRSYNTLQQMINTTGKRPVQIECGFFCVAVLMEDGSVFSVGWNEYGLFGNGTNISSNDLTPMLNTTGKRPVQIALSSFSMVVLMEDGSVYGTGYNGWGQLGFPGEYEIYNTLKPMINTTGKTVKYVYCGQYTTFVRMTDESVWTVGLDGYYRMNSSLILIQNNTGKRVKQTAVGSIHISLLSADGSVCSWGNNLHGQFGNGTNISSTDLYFTPMTGVDSVAYLTTDKDFRFPKLRYNAGVPITSLLADGYTLNTLYELGITLEQMINDGFSLTNLKDDGLTPAELKTLFSLQALRLVGFEVAQLKPWFTLAELKAGGFTVAELKAGGFTATELKDSGYEAADLKDGGFTATELFVYLEANFSITLGSNNQVKIINSILYFNTNPYPGQGYWLSDVAFAFVFQTGPAYQYWFLSYFDNIYKLVKFTFVESSQYTSIPTEEQIINRLLNFNPTPYSGHTRYRLYTLEQLKYIFTLAELTELPLAELKDHFTLVELKYHFTLVELKDHFTAAQLKDSGYTDDVLQPLFPLAYVTFDGTGVLTRATVRTTPSLSGIVSAVITGYDGIGYGAFSYLTNLSSVSISSSVTSIGDYAFYNCSALDSFTVPTDSQLTSIGNFAFQGCPANTSVTIPLN
jgi:alpha-tubulin suppressor-like RCC1 family protein